MHTTALLQNNCRTVTVFQQKVYIERHHSVENSFRLSIYLQVTKYYFIRQNLIHLLLNSKQNILNNCKYIHTTVIHNQFYGFMCQNLFKSKILPFKAKNITSVLFVFFNSTKMTVRYEICVGLNKGHKTAKIKNVKYTGDKKVKGLRSSRLKNVSFQLFLIKFWRLCVSLK